MALWCFLFSLGAIVVALVVLMSVFYDWQPSWFNELIDLLIKLITWPLLAIILIARWHSYIAMRHIEQQMRWIHQVQYWLLCYGLSHQLVFHIMSHNLQVITKRMAH